MNGITKRTNNFVVSKAQCLILDIYAKVGQFFWLEAFSTFIYLLNWSSLSFLKYDCPLAVWLRVYNFINKSYIHDLSHLQTFGCQVYAKISIEKRVISKKTAPVHGWEGYFIEYNSKSIYWVYFPNSQQIMTIRNLKYH